MVKPKWIFIPSMDDESLSLSSLKIDIVVFIRIRFSPENTQVQVRLLCRILRASVRFSLRSGCRRVWMALVNVPSLTRA